MNHNIGYFKTTRRFGRQPGRLAARSILMFVGALLWQPAARAAAPGTPPETIPFHEPAAQPDLARLPRFHSSDPAWDAFTNEYFMRHLSVDGHGIYPPSPHPLSGAPTLGATDAMWLVEWDCWLLPWVDRGAMGLARQGGHDIDTPLTTLRQAVIDKYGYVWGSRMAAEGNNQIGGYRATFCWPWPKYFQNPLAKRPTGWEFNDPADKSRAEWEARDIDLTSGTVDCCLQGKITGPHPELITPAFDMDVFQVPIIELDIIYKDAATTDTATSPTAPRRPAIHEWVNGLKIYWTTDTAPEFSEERSVDASFADTPPLDYTGDYAAIAAPGQARFPLYFPMYLNPQWGREGRRITRLKIVPVAPAQNEQARGLTIALNYLRASYDVRMSTTNATLINASWRFLAWNENDGFLRAMLPRLREAMLFMNEHLQGKKDGLLNFAWMAGKDGLGGDQPGHGLIGSYFDLLPAGRWDLESSTHYYLALLAMANLEEMAAAHGVTAPAPQVLGPDNQTTLTYAETPGSLRALAVRVKGEIERRFWNPQTGRFGRNLDVNGKLHDYGFLHHNLLALAAGLGTPAQRDSILTWLDGERIVAGDTSTGADIYKWRFAPRITTRRNADYYFWPWVYGIRANPADPGTQFGNQVQDGGAVPFTSFFELLARTATGRPEQIERAFARTKEIQRWFEEVKAAGGDGPEFYRAYYTGHPERGMLQGGGPPGGLGLDREFLPDATLGTIFPVAAFLGLRADERDGELILAPAVPSELEKIGADNVFYRGNHLTVEAGKQAGKHYVRLAPTSGEIRSDGKLRVRIILRQAPEGAKPTLDDQPIATEPAPGGGLMLVTPLHPLRVEW